MRAVRCLALVVLLVFFSACEMPEPPSPDGNDSGKKTQGSGGRPTVDDLGPVGSAGPQILSGDGDLHIEIAAVSGRSPNQDALGHLESVLDRETDRDVEIESSELPEGDGEYSPEEMKELSKQRKRSSSPGNPTIWIAYLDGKFSEGNALGASVGATVVVIFPDQIGTVSSLLQPGAVERAVLVHEIGHVLGLVNLGHKSAIDREDPEHPGHSKNDGSVMYWAVEDLSVGQIFTGGPPDDFDEADRQDLQAIKTK